MALKKPFRMRLKWQGKPRSHRRHKYSMRTGGIHHIYYSITAIFVAALAIPVTYYYDLFWVMLLLVVAVMLLCVFTARACLAFENELHHSVRKMGDFMRGMLDARLDVHTKHKPFARFQYRLNNILDIVDYHLRKEQVGFDVSEENSYIAKLRATGIYRLLGEHEKANLVAQSETQDIIILPPPEPDRNKYRLQIAQQMQQMERLKLEYRVFQRNASHAADATRMKLAQMHKALHQAQLLAEKSKSRVLDESDQLEQWQLLEERLMQEYQEIETEFAEYHQFFEEAELATKQATDVILDMQQSLDSAAEISDIIYAIAGEAHLLSLSASKQAILVGASDKNAANVADEAQGLVRHAEAASELINQKVSIIQTAVQATLDQVMSVQQSLSRPLLFEGLRHKIAASSDLLEEFLQAQQAEESKQEEAPSTPPYQLFMETLDLLIQLSDSVQKDLSVLQQETSNKNESKLESSVKEQEYAA